MHRLSYPILTAFVLSACFMSTSSRAADHLDAPAVEDDPRLDINDVYAFQSPANANNSVLVMTVNPMAGMLGDATFNSRGSYEIHIDTDGDAISNQSFRFAFTRPRRGNQIVSMTNQSGGGMASGSVGTNLAVSGGGTLRVDTFEDPFFFDLNGFENDFQFTGDDFFAGLNVTAIVLEVPSASLNGPDIGVWAVTSDVEGRFDRMGRPAINTVLIPDGQKNAFNLGDPVDDLEDFGDVVEAMITALSDAENAAALTPVLLPDILTFDTSDASGFLNGRRLADDVIDAELTLLTDGALTTDMVDSNDATFLNVFPYLAAPN